MKIFCPLCWAGWRLANVFTDITANSIVDVTGIVLYLSIIAVFVFLTVQTVQKDVGVRRAQTVENRKKIRKKAGRIFGTAGTKNGVYSVGLTVIVLAVVIVFNLIIGQIPEAYRNIDVSSTKIYDISDITKTLDRVLKWI